MSTGKRGRPATGKVDAYFRLRQETVKIIDDVARQQGIEPNELIDRMFAAMAPVDAAKAAETRHNSYNEKTLEFRRLMATYHEIMEMIVKSDGKVKTPAFRLEFAKYKSICKYYSDREYSHMMQQCSDLIKASVVAFQRKQMPARSAMRYILSITGDVRRHVAHRCAYIDDHIDDLPDEQLDELLKDVRADCTSFARWEEIALKFRQDAEQ